MVKKQVQAYKALLEATRDELRGTMNRNQEDIHIDHVPDELDNVVSKNTRELALAERDRNAVKLRRILAALQRIQKGDYGVCILCEEDIAEKRLKALPWAERCLSCESAHEKLLMESVSWGLEETA